jgi:hypothetical protein
MATLDPAHSASTAVRALFALRWAIGGVLRLDGDDSGLDARVPMLRDRLPADLRDGPVPPLDADDLPFKPMYLTDDEWALEIANQTMHGVMHLGWVPDGEGGYRAQMAVLVKPNGLLGNAYMAAIKPFRHLVVYPSLLRDVRDAWAATGKVRQVAVPPAARELSTLPAIDYADTFVLETDAARERTAEQWARSVLEDAPAATRKSLQSGWSAIGLKSGNGSTVLGWEVRDSTPDHLLLGRDSRIGMPGELLFKREPDRLVFATFVQQGNPAAKALWAGVEPVHVPTVRRILEDASRRWEIEPASARSA